MYSRVCCVCCVSVCHCVSVSVCHCSVTSTYIYPYHPHSLAPASPLLPRPLISLSSSLTRFLTLFLTPLPPRFPSLPLPFPPNRLCDQGLEIFAAAQKEKIPPEVATRLDRLEGRVERLKRVNHDLLQVCGLGG